MSLTPQQLHQKNMNFFASNYKVIHDHLIRLKHHEYELLIDAASGDADVKIRGQLLYKGSGKNQAEIDYQAFINSCGEGRLSQSMEAVRPSLYAIPRTAHTFISNFLSQYVQEDSPINTAWPIPSFYPQVVVMGIGLGLHITKFLANHHVHNLILFESDFTMILMSTFVTDWEDIYKQQSKPGHSLTILTGRKEQGRQAVLRCLATRAPHFPLSTHFFIHNSNLDYLQIAKAAHRTRHLIPPSWGQYDDEINQTNHIVQNLKNGIRLIPDKSEFKLSKPVIVVGAGPSLDRHFEKIKELRDSYLVFSAGSAITALLEQNIVPDLHVEIESDYLTYKKLSESSHSETIKKIPLCAAVQCSPFLFEMFEQKIAFVKDSLYSAPVLEPIETNLLRFATPTCTNTAASLAAHFMAPEVRLLGVDLGYYDTKQHHSKSSLYFEDSDIGKELNAAMDKVNSVKSNQLTRAGYNGPIQTYWVFDLARESLERLIQSKRDVLFINHSDGAVIQGCLRDVILDAPRRKQENSMFHDDIIHGLLNNGNSLTYDDASRLHTEVIKIQNHLFAVIDKALKEKVSGDPTEYISRKSGVINSALLNTERKTSGVSIILSGTIRQYLYMGLSTILMTQNEEMKKPFAIDWKKNLITLLKLIQSETDAIFKQSPDSKYLERLNVSIMDPIAKE
ncbi:MAG: motility associated factor glycosyltransferase family protein [Natronospirillum sp.]